jgi:4-alpha-glucanotransferase
MKFPRASGILLHPTSLPGPYGVGDFGSEAHGFVDFLTDAGQKLWQVLPLNPTGYGDSPFQCFSASAGNPLLIDLERLVQKGLLQHSDFQGMPRFSAERVEFASVIAHKFPLLRKGAAKFLDAADADKAAFTEFCRLNARWLDEFALFMSCKNAHQLVAWTRWPAPLAQREPAAIEKWKREHSEEIEVQKFLQFEFFEQWEELRGYARQRGIQIIGDVPIYVAHDSSDVWANREYFLLDESGNPAKVAGVPPDYFSATGQLWGNPIYNWERHKATGYKWWVERFRDALHLYDIVRIDHFRGFEAYYEIPGGETTAQRGEWVKGPGAELFEVLQAQLGALPLIAENLGVITPEVEAIRYRFELPGMAILQFAFGKDPQGPSFRPHNYVRELVAYTGTHDNDTVMGWWMSKGGADSIRTPEDVEKELAFARAYLNLKTEPIHLAMIRGVLSSVANTAIVPVQDLLGLGSEARMNLPGTPSGNWRWRVPPGALTQPLAQRLQELTRMYDR